MQSSKKCMILVIFYFKILNYNYKLYIYRRWEAVLTSAVYPNRAQFAAVLSLCWASSISYLLVYLVTYLGHLLKTVSVLRIPRPHQVRYPYELSRIRTGKLKAKIDLRAFLHLDFVQIARNKPKQINGQATQK
jgi:hypothetical protein